MIDLESESQRGGLLRAVKSADEAMEPHRRVRMELLRDHVGSWYSTSGARQEVVVNLINQTARIYSRVLAANNPRVKVVPRGTEHYPFARRFQTAINKLIFDIQLDQTLRACIMDAFFFMGVAKVCLADSGQLQFEQDVWYDPGQAWVERISADSLIVDMKAKEISKMRFSGDKYRAPWKRVKEEPSYNKKAIEAMGPTKASSQLSAVDAANDLASGGTIDDDEIEEMVWLMDLWLPENNAVVTMCAEEGMNLPPLSVRPWTGSKGGPYKYLGLGLVPDNVIPSSPASNLKPLHDLLNTLYRKMSYQARRQKSTVAYPPGGDADAERGRRARDGDWFMVSDPRNLMPLNFGGVDAGTSAFSLAMNDAFNKLAGNIQGLGGLGAQAGTLGQEELIQEQLQAQVADMQYHVVQFANDIVNDLGEILWDDEFMEIAATEMANSAPVAFDRTWRPGHREGSFRDYDITVEPYSMVYVSPGQKVQKFYSVLQQLTPILPILQAAGVSLDGEQIVNTLSDYLDMPELARMITYVNPAMAGGGGEVRQSPVTTRNEIRKSVPTGGTPENRSMVLQQLLGGQSVTPQQGASLMRSPA
jgi:hypothetical protein